MVSRFTRLAPLSGLLFLASIVLGFMVLGGNTPDSDAAPAKVVSFYTQHRGQQQATALIVALGCVFLLLFVCVLWQEARARGGETIATAVVVAGVTTAIGFLAMAAAHFALADVARKVDPVAAQALNAIDGDSFLISLAGTFFLGATLATAVLRLGILPRGFGYVAIALCIVMVTPMGWIAWLLMAVWLAVAGIVLSVRGGRPMTAAPAEPAVAMGT
jgi:hypothetical protein